MTIFAFVLILLVLVFVHELGHFVSAKAFGVRVHEFGFGYPPRIAAFKRGETEYSVNWLPLGGFVRLAGEEDPSEKGALAAKSPWVRLVVLAAGSFMNVLLPVLLFSASWMIPQHVTVGDVSVKSVAVGSPAERAGLQPGDLIHEVAGRRVRNGGELVYATQLNLGNEISMVTERAGQRRVIEVKPRYDPPSGQGPIGFEMQLLNFHRISESFPLWEAVPKGFGSSVDTLRLFKNMVVMLVAGGGTPEVAGPIGIAQVTDEVAEVGGFVALLQFTALLSMNLAVINMLPIPMLDGGRIVFVLAEIVRRGRRVAPERERLAHLVGFMLLLTLIVVISYFDVLRLAQGHNIFE